jgi:hypothetical protein
MRESRDPAQTEPTLKSRIRCHSFNVSHHIALLTVVFYYLASYIHIAAHISLIMSMVEVYMKSRSVLARIVSDFRSSLQIDD